MASYMLFDSLYRLTNKKNNLTNEEKIWLIDSINNKLNIEGQEKLYSLLVVYNKQQVNVYDPKEPFYDIEKIKPRLQIIWFEFTKMHLKVQINDQVSSTTSRHRETTMPPDGSREVRTTQPSRVVKLGAKL